MPHPHGQIYAFPFLPPSIERELESAAQYYGRNNQCLYCRLLRDELADGRRIVKQNDSLIVGQFVPRQIPGGGACL